MAKGMLKFFWLLISLMLTFVIAGCVNPPTNIPPSPKPENTTGETSSCQLLGNKNIPVDSAIKDSHILYLLSTQKDGDIRGQIWVYSVRDGKFDLLLDQSGFMALGLSFLNDDKHFIFIGGSSVWLSDISGSAPQKYDSANSFLDDFRPYTPIWNLLAYIDRKPYATDWESGILHSPDDKETASWSSGASALVIRNQYGKEVKIIDTDNLDTIDGIWSPDGKEFIFSYYRDFENYSQVLSVNADGSNLHPITRKYNESLLGGPYWSPDGQKIAFVRDVLFDRYLTILDLNIGQEKSFKVSQYWAHPILHQNEIVWSPDSKWILYVSAVGHNGIEALNLVTGEIYCLTSYDQSSVVEMMDWH